MDGLRKAAFAAGQTTYRTGRACKYGHIAERFVSSGACVQCNRDVSRAYVRAKAGATCRILVEGLHADDVPIVRDFVAGIKAARDAAATARAPNIDAVRAQVFPDLKNAPPGYTPPRMEPR